MKSPYLVLAVLLLGYSHESLSHIENARTSDVQARVQDVKLATQEIRARILNVRPTIQDVKVRIEKHDPRAMPPRDDSAESSRQR